MKSAIWVRIVAAVLLLCGFVLAEGNPNEENGLKPYGSYHGGDVDTVSLTNGNVMLHIPLFSYPQRGDLRANFFLETNSKGWVVHKYHNLGGDYFRWEWDARNPWNTLFGVALTSDQGIAVTRTRVITEMTDHPDLDTVSIGGYSAVTVDGASHSLDLVDFPDQTILRTDDTTGIRFNLSPNPDLTALGAGDSGTIIDRNGVRYALTEFQEEHITRNVIATSPQEITETTISERALPISMEDRNGNKISGNFFDGSGLGMTDSVGRFFNPQPVATDFQGCQNSNPISGANIINFPGPNGGSTPIKFCYANFGINTGSMPGGQPASTTVPLLVTVVLPNGTRWAFNYDSYGNVMYVALPTGGTISYTYITISQCTPFGSYTTSNRAVATRTVNANDGTGPHTWNYSYVASAVQGGVTTTVTNPTGDDTLHVIMPIANTCSLYETQTQYFQGTGGSRQLLKTVDTQYSQATGPSGSNPVMHGANVVPKVITTTMSNGKVTQVQKDYAQDSHALIYGNVSEEREYDYGQGAPGPLLRKTITSLLWQNNLAYYNLGMLDLPASTIVQDGGSNQLASTTYNYDQTGLAASGITTQHDTAPATGTTRGNLTSLSRWLNTTNTSITSTSSYFDTGSIYQTTDPLGRTTTFTYDPAFAGAFATEVQMPDTVSGGVTTHHVTYTGYDFNTGLKTSVTDQNGTVAGDPAHSTSFAYDNLWRPLSITGPPDPNNGGQQAQTVYNYDDSITAFSPNVLTQQKIDGRQTQSYTLFDGLGRAIRTARLNDEGDSSNLYDQTDVCFDSLGRKSFETYPYRSSGFNAPYACSNTQRPGDTFAYDALGRLTATTKADGGLEQTDYSSLPTVTATDETGRQRRSTTDGLGRLIEVDEPGGTVSPGAPGTGSATVSGSEQSVVTTAAAPGTGSVAVSGTEQSVTSPGTQATGAVTINGSEHSTTILDPNDPCDPVCGGYITVYDSGSVTVTVNGYSQSASYERNSIASTLAITLAAGFNADPASPVTATVSGTTVYLTSKAAGSTVNYSLSTSYTFDTDDFYSPSFWGTPSGATLTGGSDQTTFDTGTAWVAVNGTTYQASYGQSDTAATVAQKLQTALGPSVVTAALSGSTITLTAKATGANTNYSLSAGSSTSQPGTFSQPSFSISVSGPALTGGHDAGLTYDTGSVWVAVNGTTYSVNYGQPDTVATLVSKLQTALASSPVTASPSGGTITLTAKTIGANTNYSLSAGSSTNQPSLFAHPSFTVAASGAALTGGSDPTQPSLATPQVTLYSYDALGNLLCVEQHGNVQSTGCSASPSQDAASLWRVRRFTYDSLSRLLTATNPESGTIRYSYDNNNNLISKIAPAPNQTGAATVTTNFGYDELNRLVSKSFSSGGGVVLLYDRSNLWGITIQNGIGRLSTEYNYAATGSGDSVGFVNSYDVMGHTVYQLQFNQRIPVQVNKAFNYAYNLDGSLKSITYPNGRVVQYAYNAAQRAVSGTDSANNYYTAAHYTPFGGLSSMVYGSTPSFTGITWSNSFNVRMQPVFLSAASPSQTVLNLGYNFTSCNSNGGNNGNVCQVNNNKIGQSGRSESFQYDALNRLQSATSSQWNQTYAYDIWGNLLQKSVGGSVTPPDTPLNLTVNGRNQATNWCYDAAGNVVDPTQPCPGSPPYPNIYDAENRLTSAKNTAGVITSFDYDAEGRRVKKSSGTLYWYGPGGEVLEETDLSGNLKKDYIFFNGKRTARVDASATVHYYFSDHLGSADVITNATGTIVEREDDFYPFGAERVITDTGIGDNYKFTGKERDPETGCDYFGARYYCNPIGRFITADWAASPTAVPYANFGNPQSLNLYSYVKNNPTTFGDPDGHCETTCQILKGVAIGATKFLWNTSIPGMAVNGMRQGYHDFKVGPAAAHAEHVAQGKALLTVAAAASGNTEAQYRVAVGVANTWQGMNTTEKSSAITQGVLTVASIAVPAAMANSGAAAATETTTLFRGVGSAELSSIESTGAFTPSPTGSEFKGFFFNEGDASSFASRMTEMTGDTHTVVSGEAPTELVNSSPVHDAATEGPGVLIKNEDLSQVRPHTAEGEK